MKYYESHYEEYIQAVDQYNIHPELISVFSAMPREKHRMENLIFYGPSGVGKYSQILSLIRKYSPSDLKYDKKMIINNEKQKYIYRISDVHYEVDMSLLGCNSKPVWHELFFQIIDIISVKPDKFGIILCKNFHQIHSELLEIFYSYMQHYNHLHSNLKIVFIIMTEQISFLPKTMIQSCKIINIRRPSKEQYMQITSNTCQNNLLVNMGGNGGGGENFNTMHSDNTHNKTNAEKIMNYIDTDCILNAKEMKSFAIIKDIKSIPNDIFNIVCDNIVTEILKKESVSFTGFRDILYDILTYNLEVSECLYYIIYVLVKDGNLTNNDDVRCILDKTFLFLKYYNNNYRPIYHLENMMFFIINKLHKYV